MTTRTPHHATSRRFSFAFALTALLVIALAAALASGQKAPPQPAPAAQTTPNQQQAFEVAAIRLSQPSASSFYINGWGTDQFTGRNVTLQLLISIAYNVPNYKNILGAPGWLDSQRYDIEAKTEGSQILNFEQLREPLRLLLEQRFHLVIHRDTKVGQGFALVVAKGGPKLKPSKEGEQPYGTTNPNGIESPATKLRELALMLEDPAGGPVVDKTGIAGTYNFNLNFAPANHPDSSLPSVFTVVQEQLGLKLVPQKVPIDTLVIDHVDKVPTEN